ncbi:hypothetical protein CN918_26175 [Priestia megaterium]|nr:hypothetical protein CN918_26175 [Priestia megaterium]
MNLLLENVNKAWDVLNRDGKVYITSKENLSAENISDEVEKRVVAIGKEFAVFPLSKNTILIEYIGFFE